MLKSSLEDAAGDRIFRSGFRVLSDAALAGVWPRAKLFRFEH